MVAVLWLLIWKHVSYNWSVQMLYSSMITVCFWVFYLSVNHIKLALFCGLTELNVSFFPHRMLVSYFICRQMMHSSVPWLRSRYSCQLSFFFFLKRSAVSPLCIITLLMDHSETHLKIKGVCVAQIVLLSQHECRLNKHKLDWSHFLYLKRQ